MSGFDKYEKIVELAKRRGFFWPSYEIYGGVAGFYDLGPLGTLLKNRIVEKWREWFVKRNQGFVVEIETPIIMPYKVLEASGHVEHFTDPIVECLRCGRKFRADQLVEESLNVKVEGMGIDELSRLIRDKGVKCPLCGGELSDVKLFNLLFTTTIGPYSQDIGFLRPEAAQGIFTAFKRVYEAFRERLPIGIAQIGRVARNEISPRQGIVRLREFTIMEVEFFFDPDTNTGPSEEKYLEQTIPVLTAEDQDKGASGFRNLKVAEAVENSLFSNNWIPFFLVLTKSFMEALKIPEGAFRFREKLPNERAHYAKQLFDCEIFLESWGWTEVAGFAYRTDYDLSGHMKVSGEDMNVFISSTGRKIVPHVVEPSFGAERLLYALLEHSLRMEEDGRVYLSTPPYLSPFDVSVFPLLSKPDFVSKAKEVAASMDIFKVNFDDSGSIGRRYARSDEIGIPFAVTVDHQTFSDNTVTLRFRDSREQIRIPIANLLNELSKLLSTPRPAV